MLFRSRLSGVWTPVEWADSTPEWLGEAGALLLRGREGQGENTQGFRMGWVKTYCRYMTS